MKTKTILVFPKHKPRGYHRMSLTIIACMQRFNNGLWRSHLGDVLLHLLKKKKGKTVIYLTVRFPDVFPNYEIVLSYETWTLSFSTYSVPLILHRTPVNVSATKDSRNNFTTSMESLQECTQSQIQFQGLEDHAWEAQKIK